MLLSTRFVVRLAERVDPAELSRENTMIVGSGLPGVARSWSALALLGCGRRAALSCGLQPPQPSELAALPLRRGPNLIRPTCFGQPGPLSSAALPKSKRRFYVRPPDCPSSDFPALCSYKCGCARNDPQPEPSREGVWARAGRPAKADDRRQGCDLVQAGSLPLGQQQLGPLSPPPQRHQPNQDGRSSRVRLWD